MSFHEVRFPTDISYGSGGGPGFRTTVSETDAGFEQRVSHWEVPRRQYDVSYTVKTLEDANSVLEFYLAREGAANGFRFKDWLDYTSTNAGNCLNNNPPPSDTDVVIGVGDGIKTQFQLIKQYVSGAQVKNRSITKPVAGTVLISIDDVSQGAGWSVDTTTGVVTFTVPPGPGEVIKAGYEFDVPVRFGQGVDNLLDAAIQDYDNVNVASIELLELLDGIAPNDGRYPGGAIEVGIEASMSVNRTASVWILNPNAAGYVISLEDKNLVPTGGPIYTIINDGAFPIQVNSFEFDVLIMLNPGEGARFYLSQDSSNNLTWWVL